ncbi:MAG: oxidative damage protection protein [Halothiobacillaceae bacterium]|nr:oxidative damage protection protein [Halothiobacillaceae bacterium]
MTDRTVFCQRLQCEAEALPKPPYPGELGERIYNNISKAAWQQWLSHQTMLINEYRLTPVDPKAREFLVREMERFLFEGQEEKPEDYVPPSESE